ncbi:MAG: hypothetical protein ABIG31_04265 [Candidatus Omnitrophota bacterium]
MTKHKVINKFKYQSTKHKYQNREFLVLNFGFCLPAGKAGIYFEF